MPDTIEGAVQQQAQPAQPEMFHVEQNTPEQAPPQTQAAPPDDFSKRFEMLTRKERMIYEEQAKIKAEREQWREREKILSDYEEKKKIAEYDPIEFMKAYGWDADKLADYLVKNPTDPYANKYNKKMEEMESRLKQMEEDRVNNLRAQTYNRQLEEIKKFTTIDKEKYELVNEQGAYDLVFGIMAQYHSMYGEKLEIAEAAEQAEKYLDSEVDRVIKYKKAQSKFGKIANVEPIEQSQQVPAQALARPSTLTNTFAAVNTPNSNRQMTREESLARAAKLIKWND